MKEKRRRLALAATMLAVLALGVAGGVTAASGQDTVVADAALEPGMAFDGPLMIELEGEPATAAYAEARGRGASNAAAGRAGKAQKEANERAQASVLAAIRAQGISADPLYQVQTSYNGIAVNADPGTAAELAALPGVKAVHVIPVQSLDNHYTVPLIGALDAWESTGKTGAGVSIAVIDTGVDYVHRGFGGSGSSADYSAAQSPANNPSPWSSSNSSSFSIPGIYPTAKVVGGFDFAGDTYNASDPAAPINPVPRPDPNPLDCNGHGSHVAGTAAGTGVSEDGTTYTGPYDSSLDTASMDIGPGVAPKAEIYALRVFGCNGNTALTVQAINWAADPNGDGDPSDHVDIINMSLGSAYGTADDPSAAAVNNAVNAGVMVVTSAGNNTDVYYVTSSPGSATGAMATASSADESDRADAILIHEPAAIAGPAVASKSVAFNWAAVPERTGNVYYPASNQYGCSPWSAAEAAKISGRIVLVDWKLPTDATFPCGSAVRANNATAAGATGIIMADSVPFLDTAISGNASTPGMYTTSTVGNRLKSQLSPGVISGVNVTLSSLVVAEGFATGRDDTLSSFSSRGPRRGSALKPDIAAPGHSIWSVDRLTGNRGRSLNGTSMASPHMAGVSALLLEAHPTWAPSEIKALAMNTAKNDVYLEFNRSGPKYGVGRVGAGRVDVPAALESTSIAFDADEPRAVSVSFGAVEVAGTLTRSKTIRVVNRGSAAQTYTVGYDARTSIPGVSYSFPDGTSLSVPAGGSATFRVQLDADASAMQNTRDATVAGVQTGNPRHWLAEASGLVLVSPASGPQLRVPVYATARPASTSKAAAPFVNLAGGSTTGRINIAGEGVNTGPEPSGWLSKVSAFELGIQSPRRESLPTGFPAQTRHADVQYAGAATKGTNVYFGISTWEDWSTAATEQQLTVQIDRDGNGTADFHVFNTRFTDTDTFVAAGQRLNAPPTPNSPLTAFGFTNIFNSNVNTAPFNNNVVVYGVPITQIGLPAGQTSFRYRVVGFSRFWGTVDTTDWARYDVANPGLSFSDGLAGTTMYPSLDGQKIDVTYDAADYAANESKGVLLLFHLNESGKRTEVLQIRR